MDFGKHAWPFFAIALCVFFIACGDDNSSGASANLKNTPIAESTAPAFLKEGDKVALLSPSYTTPDSTIQKTAEVLKDWGFKPVIGKSVNKIEAGKFAGTAEERAKDFEEALKDTSIKAILCNRGGYGAIQLIDLIDPQLVKKNPKWVIGYSDVTTLHAMQTKAGVMSIHGTMSSSIAKTEGKDDNSTLLRDLLKGEVPTYKVPKHKYNQQGKAEGILVGGNMATFVPLIGASDIDVFQNDGIILFMEEIGENLRNIDRMFHSIELHGVMENVKGVILGEFVSSGTDLDYESTEAMLSKYLKEYDIPVICGFPAGHDDINVPIVMGSKVKMEVTNDGTTISFDIKGKKKTIDTDKITVPQPLSKALLKMFAGKTFDVEE
ncbi:LD-carboxypeptidase [Fibrobacter sp. UWB11]|uniref:S66 peptidase family protein n=1 Tax=Fibrobacter sp. UWB11 TaxID=1896202 RepID=UPI00092A88C2|nr:LD-carboxypeptidase [Fibrobacter sp. UWB11]SIO29978.1 muramoyltetrapeptide carboxypeptidase [Fibrobacter sp. UWB11]